MSNLTQRILTAIVGVPILLLVFYFGSIYFLAFILLIVALGSYEFFSLVDNRNLDNKKILGILFCIILPVGAYFGYLYFIFLFTLVSISTLFIHLQKQDLSNTLMGAGTKFLGIVYIGWFLSHAVLIRNVNNSSFPYLDASNIKTTDIGFFWIVFAVACTFLNDTGAYFVGKAKGKTKLAPRLSPGKTVEGTVAGIAMACICGVFINLIFQGPIEYSWALLMGFVVGVIAVFGDLIESMFKRSVSIKDSGGLLPGHGGVLDRFDSLILVFPVMYYLILLYYLRDNYLIF
ncbi:MAG TPA: phosphatidate cytidylyltransferase [Thermodesulfobacteriota bacterium]|nr:phosphatidate cytidylyltransferase [Thermodesulfobacteriota bacterium]